MADLKVRTTGLATGDWLGTRVRRGANRPAIRAVGSANVRSRRDWFAPKRRRRPPRDDAAKSARAQTVNDVAGGKFCHADLRVCGADSPERGRIRGSVLAARYSRLGTRGSGLAARVRRGANRPATRA